MKNNNVPAWIEQCFTSLPTQYRLYWRRNVPDVHQAKNITTRWITGTYYLLQSTIL